MTSAPAIGTGRVGPRQISKPQFSIQTVEREITIQPKIALPISPKLQHKNLSKNNPIINNHNVQKVPHIKNANVINNQLVNPILTSPDNMNSGKIKKDKKHSPKQQLPSINLNHSQSIKSGANVVTQIDVAQQQPQVQQKIQKTPVANIHVEGTKDKLASTLLPSAPILNPSKAAPVLPTPVFSGELISTPLSANEVPIIPIVDLSHKPEFQKRSIQDRLLRVRQTNNQNNSNLATTTAEATTTATPSTATMQLNPIKSDENKIDVSNTTNSSTTNDITSTISSSTEENTTTIAAATISSISTETTTSNPVTTNISVPSETTTLLTSTVNDTSIPTVSTSFDTKVNITSIPNETVITEETSKLLIENDEKIKTDATEINDIDDKIENKMTETKNEPDCDKIDVKAEIRNENISLSSSAEAVIACN